MSRHERKASRKSAPGRPGASTFGYACPDCGVPITASLKQLLSCVPIVCSNCGLELRVDEEQSKEAIAALRELRARLETNEQACVAAAGPGAVISTRGMK